jgi:histidinol-phosphate phosphatase family protein
LKKAIFLDRDGVLNRKADSGDYIKEWCEFEFLPLAVDALRLLSRTDYMLIVVTNQRGIARGLMSEGDLQHIHDCMCAELRDTGARIDHIFHCPHDIEDRCNCRKPRAGMLLKARDLLGVDLQESYLVGDSASDIEAGFNAGCKEVILIGTKIPQGFDAPGMPCRAAKDIYEAASYICKRE